MVKTFVQVGRDIDGSPNKFMAYRALADDISRFEVDNTQYIKDIHYVEKDPATVMAIVIFTTDNILKEVCKDMKTQVQHMEDMVEDLEAYKEFVDEIWDLLGDDLKAKLNEKLLVKKE